MMLIQVMVWHLNRFDAGGDGGGLFPHCSSLCFIFTFPSQEVRTRFIEKWVRNKYKIILQQHAHTFSFAFLILALTPTSLENKVMELIWWRPYSNSAASDWLLRMHNTYANMSRTKREREREKQRKWKKMKCNIIIIAFHPLIKYTPHIWNTNWNW